LLPLHLVVNWPVFTILYTIIFIISSQRSNHLWKWYIN